MCVRVYACVCVCVCVGGGVEKERFSICVRSCTKNESLRSNRLLSAPCSVTLKKGMYEGGGWGMRGKVQVKIEPLSLYVSPTVAV